MLFSSGDHIFVDESKARGYILVASAISLGSLQPSEKELRSLLKPGQRRIHFKSERDSRRKEILSRMCELEINVAVWISKGLSDKAARPLCLNALADELLESGVDRLLIERDESVVDVDRRMLAARLRHVASQSFAYEHVRPHDRPLLWVSDAVAWCFANGGDWLRRCAPLVGKRVIRL